MLEKQHVRPKIAVVGAGNIGGEIIANLMRTALREQLDFDLVLINRTEDKAKGIAKDTTNAYRVDSLGRLNPAILTATEEGEGLRDADVVIFSAGIRAGLVGAEDRNTLLPFNVGITLTTATNIKEYAPNALVVVITNPDGILTTVMQQETGFPSERVIGTGVTLDSKRFEEALYHRLVEHTPHLKIGLIKAHIIGYHNKGEMVLHRGSLRINNMPLEGFLEASGLAPETMDSIILQAEEDISNTGFEIVRLKGGEGAHIAPAAIAENIALAWIYGEEKALTASTSMVLTSENRNLYGINEISEDIPVGVITHIGQKNITLDRTISLSEEERKKLHEGAEKMFKVTAPKASIIQRMAAQFMDMQATLQTRLNETERLNKELTDARIHVLETENRLLKNLEPPASRSHSPSDATLPSFDTHSLHSKAGRKTPPTYRRDTPTLTYRAEETRVSIKILIEPSTTVSTTDRKNMLKQFLNNLVPDPKIQSTLLKSQQAKIYEREGYLIVPNTTEMKQKLNEHNIAIKPSSLAR